MFPRFRAWHKIRKKMYYFVELASYADGSTSVNIVGNSYGDCFATNTDDVELMRFAGFSDASGTEVYQGDILEGYDSGLVAVQFGEHRLYIDGAISYGTGFHTNHDGYEHYHGLSSKTIEKARVVGNIHEHAELLVQA